MTLKAIIVSDLHLGTRDSKCHEFLDFLEAHPTDLLVLNGDIIDGWALNRGSKWRKRHTKVISRILKISNTTKVIWVRGNHDEFLGEFIGSHFGNISIVEDFTLSLHRHIEGDTWESDKYLIFHGDVIDVFITKYKWLSKIGSIGYDLALRLNTLYNKWRQWVGLPYQSISQKIKQGVKAATSYINDFETAAVRMAAKRGCQGAICGHIHQPADLRTPGGHYLNSGDWVENMTALLITQEDEIRLCHWANHKGGEGVKRAKPRKG
jgi:UDP-2,3-diacylglucosamine pyrophosphatase LpxH